MQATRAVEVPYFQLPIAGTDKPIYRERVYCYELYHQMRLLWPDGCPYSLGGEVDKSGHPLVHKNGLDRLKPDFLVHVPGVMDGNYAVVEVKPVTSSLKGIKKDIAALCAFRDHADYARCLLLIYGEGGLPQMKEGVIDLLQRENYGVELWLHEAIGHPASMYRS